MSELLREAMDFLAANPDVRALDILLCDLGGVLRGKRLRRHEIERFFRDGRQLPSSILALTVTGEDVEATGLIWETGDADCLAVPVPGTLVRVPWSPQPLAQALMTLEETPAAPAVAAEPRRVLQRVVKRLRDDGLQPVVAAELEFYLLDTTTGRRGAPRPAQAPGGTPRVRQTDVYSVAELADFAPFLESLYDCCAAQGIPAETAISEYAPGQFEITLTHRNDALRAMDEALMYKRAVKGVAARFGMLASFMAKPFTDRAGSGFHFHASFEDADGRNLFTCEEPAAHPPLRHAVAGLIATMNDAFAIFAPNANSYRRFRHNSYAPVLPTWGVNNRTVSIRIPSGPPSSRHLEHRVSGADANPYLVAAVILAGMHAGISGKWDPGTPVSGDGYHAAGRALPGSWRAALDAMTGSEFIADYLGGDFRRIFLAIKNEEAARFLGTVTALDYEWYLRDA